MERKMDNLKVTSRGKKNNLKVINNLKVTSKIKLFADKKGDKILSIYWFAILVIVAVGIVAMVVVFYGKPYDVRQEESGILTMKISDCLSNGKYINKNINNENILAECHLVLNDEYYFEIDNLGIKQGNSNLKEYCGKGESVACDEKNVYYLDENNQGTSIKILSVIRKNENV